MASRLNNRWELSKLMRLRYSLRGLLFLCTFMALVIAAVVRWRLVADNIHKAQDRYAAAVAQHDSGLIMPIDLCAESFLLFAAERGYARDALAQHLKRLKQIEDQARHAAEFGLYGDEVAREKDFQTVANIRDLRVRCSSWPD